MTLLQWCDHWLLTFSLFVGVERLLDVACWHVVLFVMSLFTALHQCTNTLNSALLHCALCTNTLTSALLHCASVHQYIDDCTTVLCIMHQYIDICTTSLCISAPIHWRLHYFIVHERTNTLMTALLYCALCTNTLMTALLHCALCIAAGQSHTGTLWAATNAGVVYIYQLTVPTADKREEDIVQCILGLWLYSAWLTLGWWVPFIECCWLICWKIM